MRRLLGVGWLWVLPVLVSVACTVPLEPDSPAPFPQVLPADARALAYGRTTAEVLQNPELRDKIRTLFAADWMPPSGTPAGLTLGAPDISKRVGRYGWFESAGRTTSR